jgi:hypothetical protein
MITILEKAYNFASISLYTQLFNYPQTNHITTIPDNEIPH